MITANGMHPVQFSYEPPVERKPTTMPSNGNEPVRSQKAVKPPKPRKVEKKQRGRKG